MLGTCDLCLRTGLVLNFPRDYKTAIKWATAFGRLDVLFWKLKKPAKRRMLKACEQHFDDSDFDPNAKRIKDAMPKPIEPVGILRKRPLAARARNVRFEQNDD